MIFCKIKKAFSCRTIKRLVSSVGTPFSYKMVRHFPNPYEDYTTGAQVQIESSAVEKSIEYYIKDITKHLKPAQKHVDGGLYLGVSGIAYMFYYLSKNPLLPDKTEYMQKAVEYLRPALEVSAGDRQSFILGDAGTYAIAAAIFKQTGDDRCHEMLQRYRGLYQIFLNPNFLRCGSDELFVGRAGYLAGALWLNREMGTPVFSHEELYKICDVIVYSGTEFARKKNSPCPLLYHYYETLYLGAAHGISSILQMLLTVPGYISHSKHAPEIKATVEYIAALQNDEGNWPCCLEEAMQKDHKLVHWCHGAPGTIYLMARAYLIYNDQRYLNACIKAGDLVWKKGLLFKGPGICHGVAGNGMVFLMLFRLTQEEKYLYRAKKFAEFLSTESFVLDSRVPDNPSSLYEGVAGTVCFLSDVMVPDKAEFPFMDVFQLGNRDVD